MLTLQQILDESKTIMAIKDEYDNSTLIMWLNNINNDFFNVVKIPKVFRFMTSLNVAEYNMPSDMRLKNIDLVNVGYLHYRSLDEDDIRPLQNYYTYDDISRKMSLNPAPYENAQGVVRYRRIATTTFTSGNMNTSPDAPEEYQWTYVPALCCYIALAMDDAIRATNFENQYKSAWNAAAADYQGGTQT